MYKHNVSHTYIDMYAKHSYICSYVATEANSCIIIKLNVYA